MTIRLRPWLLGALIAAAVTLAGAAGVYGLVHVSEALARFVAGDAGPAAAPRGAATGAPAAPAVAKPVPVAVPTAAREQQLRRAAIGLIAAGIASIGAFAFVNLRASWRAIAASAGALPDGTGRSDGRGADVAATEALRCVRALRHALHDIADIAETIDGAGGTSRKISGIVAEIEDIALRTTVLAINAAVDDARAGERAGSLGAVAASVRVLAHGGTQAAREIERLVVARGDDGTSLFPAAAATVEAMAASIARLDAIASDIAAAGRRAGAAAGGEPAAGRDGRAEPAAAPMPGPPSAARGTAE